MYSFNVQINGVPVEASYRDEDVNNIFLPLLEKLVQMQRKKSRRILVMLAAPPGAGKTTLCHFLQRLARDRLSADFTVIGMDGFHRRQEYLLSHTVAVDGEELPMVRVKGAMETFDLENLRRAVGCVAQGTDCGWPVYDRMLHNPVENAVTVSGSLVLLEGNYLLSDRPGWSDLKKFADYTVRLSAPADMLRERLVLRRMATGVSRTESERFVDFSDMRNVRECLAHSTSADLNLAISSDGFYTVL